MSEVQNSDVLFMMVDEFLGDRVHYAQDPRIINDPVNSGNKCIVLTTNPSPKSADYTNIRFYIYGYTENQVIKLSMKVRADKNQGSDGEIQNQSSLEPMYYFEGPNFTKDWTEYSTFTTIISDETQVVCINLAKLEEGNNVYFDDISVELWDGH